MPALAVLKDLFRREWHTECTLTADGEGRCAFRDCLHDKETDCAVKTALAEGKIAPSRYESYGKFLEECRQRKKY